MALHKLLPSLLLLSLSAFAQPQQGNPATRPAASGAPDSPAKPPAPKPELLPDDKSIAQTISVNGKTLHYTATVGKITLKAADDKPTGEVMYVPTPRC